MDRPAHLQSLDGIRAVCITLVLGYHAFQGSNYPPSWVRPSEYLFSGGLGVQVFFVLSGFLITYILLREESRTGVVSLRNFYARRCIRILPVFVAFLATLACLSWLTGLVVHPCQYVSAITFTKNYWCATWIDGHLWSLSVEEQFYLIWPVLFAFGPQRWRWYLFAAFVVLAPVFRVWFYASKWGMLVNFSFMTNMDVLMIGSATAMAVWRYPIAVERVLSWWPTVGRLAAFAAIYAVWVLQINFAGGLFTVPFGRTVQGVAAAYLIASYSLRGKGLVTVFLNLRPVRYLGVLSYSIYIWQQLFFSKPEIFNVERSTLLDFPFNVVAAIGLAALSYHAFEKPLLGLRKKFRSGSE